MNLLIVTQKVDINDPILGFFHDWILEFTKHCDKVTIICLEKGEYNLPDKVKVLSLGKEKKVSKIAYILNFYKYIWQQRNNYDKVFVHMNPEYVVMGGVFWRMCRKKISLWYTHKQVTAKLRMAELLTDMIFTASKESFNLPSNKVKVFGHGISVVKFQGVANARKKINDIFNIVCVARISSIKNQELLIDAVNYLIKNLKVTQVKVEIVGAPIEESDEEYYQQLVKKIKKEELSEYIKFKGQVPHCKIAHILKGADLSINLCPTGGLDKVVLESMASGVITIVHNESFNSILGEFKELMTLQGSNPSELAEKINVLIKKSKKEKEIIAQKLQAIVARNHELKGLIRQITLQLNE